MFFLQRNRNAQLLKTIQERNADLEDVDTIIGNDKGEHVTRINLLHQLKHDANEPKAPITQHDIDQLRLALNPFAKWMEE